MGRGSSKASGGTIGAPVSPALKGGRKTNASEKIFYNKLPQTEYAIEQAEKGNKSVLNSWDIFEGKEDVKLSTLKGLTTSIKEEYDAISFEQSINMRSKESAGVRKKALNEMQKQVNNYYKKHY